MTAYHNVMTGAEYAVRTSQGARRKVQEQMRQILNNLRFTRNLMGKLCRHLIFVSLVIFVSQASQLLNVKDSSAVY